MKLDNTKLHKLFQDKGVLDLNHANTITTSITFIEERGLLSRGGIENRSLLQTAQSSDGIDKDYNVWNDIFLDSTDLHTYFNRQNHYGPVLFKFSTDFLIHEDFEIWITKDNPINWRKTMTHEQKYFSSVKELAEKWDSYQRQRKMLTIKNEMRPILFKYLTSIVIDDPQVDIVFKDDTPKIRLFKEAVTGLKNAIGEDTRLRNKLTIRTCNSSCYCKKNYLTEVSTRELEKIFLPQDYGKH